MAKCVQGSSSELPCENSGPSFSLPLLWYLAVTESGNACSAGGSFGMPA